MAEQHNLRRIETLKRTYQLGATSIDILSALAVNVVDTVVQQLREPEDTFERLTSLEEAVLPIVAQKLKTIIDPLARADRAIHMKQDIAEYVKLIECVTWYEEGYNATRGYTKCTAYRDAHEEIVEKENDMLLDLARIDIVEKTGIEARVVYSIEYGPTGENDKTTERHVSIQSRYPVFKISSNGKELLTNHEAVYKDRALLEREVEESNDFPEGTSTKSKKETEQK